MGMKPEGMGKSRRDYKRSKDYRRKMEYTNMDTAREAHGLNPRTGLKFPRAAKRIPEIEGVDDSGPDMDDQTEKKVQEALDFVDAQKELNKQNEQ